MRHKRRGRYKNMNAFGKAGMRPRRPPKVKTRQKVAHDRGRDDRGRFKGKPSQSKKSSPQEIRLECNE